MHYMKFKANPHVLYLGRAPGQASQDADPRRGDPINSRKTDYMLGKMV